MAPRQPVCVDFSWAGNPPSARASSRYHEWVLWIRLWSVGAEIGSIRPGPAVRQVVYPSASGAILLGRCGVPQRSGQREDAASRAWGRYGLVSGIRGKPTSSILGPVTISITCRSGALARASSGPPAASRSSSKASMARRATAPFFVTNPSETSWSASQARRVAVRLR